MAEYGGLEGIAWRWQSIDGSMMKAPMAKDNVGPNPTDRGEKRKQTPFAGGQKWRLLLIVINGANRHDVTQVEAVLEAVALKAGLKPFP